MKLYVGNLSFETTENDLQDLFEQHGQGNEVRLMTDRTVRHEADFVDLAMLFEQILKIVLGGLKREITYVQFHCVLNFGKTTELQSRSRESGFKPPMSDAHLTIYRAVKLDSLNPISAHYRPCLTKHKLAQPPARSRGEVNERRTEGQITGDS